MVSDIIRNSSILISQSMRRGNMHPRGSSLFPFGCKGKWADGILMEFGAPKCIPQVLNSSTVYSMYFASSSLVNYS
jgi:hypothetical protein